MKVTCVAARGVCGAILLIGASPAVPMTGRAQDLSVPVFSCAHADPSPRPQEIGMGSGEVSWTLPGRVVTDARGSLYQSLEKGAASAVLSRLDRATGKALWSRTVSGSLADASCITASVLIMKAGGEVLGIDTATGKTSWSTHLDDGLGPEAYLSCPEPGDLVFLHYGPSPNRIMALHKLSGESPWTFLRGGYADPRGVTPSRVVIVKSEASAKTLTALDAEKGEVRWAQVVKGAFFLTFDRRGDIVLVDDGEVRLLDANTGRERWSYRGGGGHVSPALHEQAIFIAEKDRLVRLDESSGKAIWTYEYRTVAEEVISPIVLRSGEVIIRAVSYRQRQSSFALLDPKSGRAVWSRKLEDSVELLTEDQAGTLYLIGGNTVARLSRDTGATVWTFARHRADPGERLFGVIGGDERSLYLSYGKSGRKHPPMGLIALDRAAGTLRWETVFPSPIYLVGSDESRLYVSIHNERVSALSK